MRNRRGRGSTWRSRARALSTGRPACFFFQAEDGIRDWSVTGVQTCALPICRRPWSGSFRLDDRVLPVESGNDDRRRRTTGRVAQRLAWNRTRAAGVLSSMRVLFTSTRGAGHFGPLVPFARACVRAGHNVLVAAPSEAASMVRGAGFAFRPFADPAPELVGPVFAQVAAMNNDAANEIVIREVFGRIDASAALPGLLETVDAFM